MEKNNLIEHHKNITFIYNNVTKYFNNKDGSETILSTIKTFYNVNEYRLLLEEIIEHLEFDDIAHIRMSNPTVLNKILNTGEYYKLENVYLRKIEKS